jgi:RNA polymerase sigma-70 factor (ECF subfamily)
LPTREFGCSSLYASPCRRTAADAGIVAERLKNWQDEASWQAFFDTYWKLIYGVARQAGLNPDEAQDAVQETMVSAAKNLPTFKYDPKIGSFKAWLLNMTRWRIVDQKRKRGPLSSHHILAGDSPTGTGTVEKIPDPCSDGLDRLWEQQWEQTLLEAAWSNVKRRLDPLKCQIFDSYVNKHWPAEKVAAAVNVPVDQVYWQNIALLRCSRTRSPG